MNNPITRHFKLVSCRTSNISARCLVGGLLALVCAVALPQVATSAPAAGRQQVRGHIPPGLEHVPALHRLAGTNRLELVIGLPLRNAEALDALLKELYDPASPSYRHYLTPPEFAERFGPSERDYRQVIAFAESHGFRVTGQHPNRTLLDVSGSVADIEKTFHLKMHVYQHPSEGRTFYAPDAEPSLDLAVPLAGINGLDNFVLPQPMGLRMTSLENAPEGTVYATGGGPRGTFLGRDFRTAYAPGVTLDGTGEAVGLFELDGYYLSDVLAYETLAGLTNVPLTNVLLNNFSGLPGSHNDEVALDIDMAIAMAPGLSRVIVYEGKVANDILNRMATDNQARQLSCSWGFGSTVDTNRDKIFLQFQAQGQSFFQASGDSNACCTAYPPPPPSDNPYVTSVGGTFLSTSDPGGAWSSETVWNRGRQSNGGYLGSGGGVSTAYPIPSWQQGLDMTCNGGSTTKRNYPDVAGVADALWIVVNNGEEVVLGGTSAAAPLWASFTALVNQQAADNGQPSVGWINPALYAIGKSSSYASAFHDVTIGNNTNGYCGANKYFACPGYDLCTGWGTPTGSNLIAALLAPPPALRITPAAPLIFTGPVGGAFRPAVQSLVLTNDSNAALSWTLSNTASWLNVSPASGLLTNGGAATTVSVTLTPAASSLATGSYVATLWFTNVNLTNANDRLGQSRQVMLDIVTPPVIAVQPINQTVLEGMTASFTVGVANSTSVSYQWQYDNGVYVTNLTDGGYICGSAASTLVISNAQPGDAGAYSVIVSNAAGAVSSSEAFLAVFLWRPVITTQPASQTVLAGQMVRFTVVAVGLEPLFYLWQRNGNPLTDGGNISGAAASTLTLHSAALADMGTYSVVVGNADGLAASAGAVLAVTSIAAPGTTLTTLYSFTGSDDGGNPNGLLRAANGSFYGTTQNGGTNAAGTVFQMTAGGAVMGLYSFTGGNDGGTPPAALAQGPDGNFYGTTFQGGDSDNGTVFRITPSGVLSNLISLILTNGLSPKGSLPSAGLTLGSDLNFYGTTYQGGAAGRGTAFRVSTNGTHTVLYSFNNGQDGGHVAAGLLRGSDGNFYGATYKGGAYFYGTVFRITAAGALTTLASLNNTNGAFPLGELVQSAETAFYGAACQAGTYGGFDSPFFADFVQGADWTFYGTASQGGTNGSGAIFRMTPAGLATNLYSFRGGTNESCPTAALLQGRDGNFYGTTAYGGAYGDGTLFRISPNGTLTTLVAFDGYAGANPQAALIEDADGSLLGTTQNGGESDAGVVFRVSFSGPLQITGQPASRAVYVGENLMLSVAVCGTGSFFYQWQKNGSNLVEGSNISGVTNRVLTLTNVAAGDAGTYSVRVSHGSDSTNSVGASLIVTSSPPIIVMAPTNLTPHPGNVGKFTVVADGNKPLCFQWQYNNGVTVTNLAGFCSTAGPTTSSLTLSNLSEASTGTYTVIVSNGLGSTSAAAALTVVPVINAPGTRLATQHWFKGGNDGGIPNGLVQGTNGNLYGTAQSGGLYNAGTVFRLTPDGTLTNLVSLVSFDSTNGASPRAALVQGADGNFYGTTYFGGSNNLGTVFEWAADSSAITNFHSFAGDDGANPAAALVQGADGNFYGTTYFGGSNNVGTVFRITFNGVFSNFTKLYEFRGADGRFPAGGLAQGCAGNFYGLTAAGGSNDLGTIFEITPAGEFTNLYSFNGRDGSTPAGALLRGSDCNLYGVTCLGGAYNNGEVFRMAPTGGLVIVKSFGNFYPVEGSYPRAGLIQSIDGNLYGTTYDDLRYYGQRPAYGTVFRIAPNGSGFTTLLFLDGFDTGEHPESALVAGADGSFYGTTSDGGLGGYGTIFRLSFAPQIITQPTNRTVAAGASTAFTVSLFGTQPFSYQWRLNGNNLPDGGNVSGAATSVLALNNVAVGNSGTYSVVVTNFLGSVTSAGAVLTVVSPPVFLAVSQTNGTLTVTWSAVSGRSYQLQYKADLASTNWLNLSAAIGATGSTVTTSDTINSNSRRFYRVLLLP